MGGGGGGGGGCVAVWNGCVLLSPTPCCPPPSTPRTPRTLPCRRRMTPQPIKVRADVEMTCFAYDGVERIREAMRAALGAGTEACPVSIKLVAAPRYVLTTQTLDKAQVWGVGVGVGRGGGGGDWVVRMRGSGAP